MVVNCEIEFDNNPDATYFGGQLVTGKVVLIAEKPKQVKAVALKINGFAHTQWQHNKHHHGVGHHHRHRHYQGHEDYIASITYLLGSDANTSVTLETGIHTYTFACHLPPNCPSSFEGSKGHVRYTVRLILVRPWKYDVTFTKGFTVLTMFDLNYDSPLLKVPANAEMEKVFCCWPCRTEPLKLHVTLPQSGYVPGQSIPLTLLVTNDSRIPVKEISVKLVMVACYYSQTPAGSSVSDRTTVTKFKADSVMRHCRKLFNYELAVPATPPTCLSLCRLIQISYVIEVEAKMPGTHSNQVICVPVTIGNVPLVQLAAIEQQPTGSGQRPFTATTTEVPPDNDKSAYSKATAELPTQNGARNPVTPSAPWDYNANIPPPNYEEAVHMQHANINAEAHDYGPGDFAPRYPVFNVPSPTAPTPEGFDGGFTNGNVESNKGTWL